MSLFKKLFGRHQKEEGVERTPAPPPEPEPEAGPIQINEISPKALSARLNNGDDLIVVDMRQAWEYQAGHIPGAKHIFIHDIPYRMNELPQDVDIVFQCWHGNTSLNASAFLIENGWPASRVASLSGGIAGWIETHGSESLVKD
jgi:rhodanese-related sulfurtransferase